MKCDNCNKPATVHLTEIKSGKKIEKHLCEQCAAQNEGLPVKSHMPINELLTNFVMAHSGLQKEAGTKAIHAVESIEVWRLERKFLDALEARLERTTRLELTRTDGQLYVTMGGTELSGSIEKCSLVPSS